MSIWIILSFCVFCSCSSNNIKEIDELNETAYGFHYRNIDSSRIYALKALKASNNYSAGKAEAYNNLAFVAIAQMKYQKAFCYIDSVYNSTDNQVELLIADITGMRLCQRMAKNKDFYDYNEHALYRLNRINQEINQIQDHLYKRFIYAKSEYYIVKSTYYYYVGLREKSALALSYLDNFEEITKDTAQFLNYLYQKGSGDLLLGVASNRIQQVEFEYLIKCYALAIQGGYIYWEANALQSISEHIIPEAQQRELKKNNDIAFRYLNSDNMPDSLLSGYWAQKSLNLFSVYGDVYQESSSYRTLAVCYRQLGDYKSSLYCLIKALNISKNIIAAPDLVASIREQLSITYAALNDKYNSDINRNLYLDLQERTRQDRQLEARASQLENSIYQLNLLIGGIIIAILFLALFIFFLRKRHNKQSYSTFVEQLLLPLMQWEKSNKQIENNLQERREKLQENLNIVKLNIEKSKERNVENRAKIFLVNNIIPYIDRILNEIYALKNVKENNFRKLDIYEYIDEILNSIEKSNNLLTQWIQLQRGQLSLHIESFSLNEIFSVIAKASSSFQMKGILLDVHFSDIVVKADKVLTLFMLNTLSDNARRYTPTGGKITITAENKKNYVEISVWDTGCGISSEKLVNIFDHKISNGHGFGLMNCRGIIEKYKKISSIFAVCGIFAESKVGKGSRFYFRLPYGKQRIILFFCFFLSTLLLPTVSILALNIRQNSKGDTHDVQNSNKSHADSTWLVKASKYADAAYYSNVNADYAATLNYADSAFSCINAFYKEHYNYKGNKLQLHLEGKNTYFSTELIWFKENIKVDYNIILDLRNECAVAALALHKWTLYSYNNSIYTQLFKLKSADSGLFEYCRSMQRSNTNKIISIFILVGLLLMMLISFYIFYYRHILYFRFCVEHVKSINEILLSDKNNKEKLQLISSVNSEKFPNELKNVVIKIIAALKDTTKSEKQNEDELLFLEDRLKSLQYENDKLYISNNVIDNCLSTLKHETMYYPSRIRQLLKENNISTAEEVIVFFQELYNILSAQVNRQIIDNPYECKMVSLASYGVSDVCVQGDKVLLAYLFKILYHFFGKSNVVVLQYMQKGKYVVLTIVCTGDKAELLETNIFSPSVKNIPFLICRQIVREHNEMLNMRNCGIEAKHIENGLQLDITLVQANFNKQI